MSVRFISNPIASLLPPTIGSVSVAYPIMGSAALFPASGPVGGFGQAYGSSQSDSVVQSIIKMLLMKTLLESFQKLIQPDKAADKTPVTPDRPAAETIGDVDFRALSKSDRTDMSGLSDRERAVLHLWGRQMIGKGLQDGGILLTVQEFAKSGKKGDNGSVLVNQPEVDLSKELIAKDKAKYGGITGKSLDQEFFKVYKKLTGKDISAKYASAPTHFAKGPTILPTSAVDSTAWEKALEKQNGLSGFENSVLRLWGHNPLFTGKIDGAILPFTLSNSSALDKGMNKGDVKALLESDMAADGVLNGDSLEGSFVDVMDKLYLGKEGASVVRTKQEAQTRAEKLGRTAKEVAKSTTTGVQDAIKNVGQLMKDHPILTTVGAGGLVAALAICPFLAGMGAGGAAIALGQNAINK